MRWPMLAGQLKLKMVLFSRTFLRNSMFHQMRTLRQKRLKDRGAFVNQNVTRYVTLQ